MAASSQGQLQVCEAVCAAGLPRVVLQSRVPVPQGSVCQGRNSAACHGQPSACLANSPQCCGEKLWGERATLSKAGSFCCQEGAAQVRAACASRLPQDISKGTFQEQGQCGDYVEDKELS